ncbi:hypothetical protein ZWY2020_014018 [Hordeum vulgare]|nr:hypothetical protein ZWY2020_014018 [Hordeum vulgare]
MPRLRRVRPRRACDEDRLSALPDGLMSRLDTAAVSDILPPEYDRTVALRRRNLPRDAALASVLDGLMASCEVSTMRAFVDGITGFLDADGGAARQCVKTLRLDVDPAPAPQYSFPHGRLKDGGRSRLRSLTLGNCTVPPRLHRYDALTTLVLRDMPASTPVALYERVLSECKRLQVLHLTSCCCAEDRLVVCSQIRELVVDACSFMVIELRDLPMLARLACLTNTVELVFGSVPCLTHTNLSFSVEEDTLVLPPKRHHHDQLNHFLGTSPTMANLVIRFTGPKRWIGSKELHKPLLHLKRLLIADLPSNWDVSWTRNFLMDAPSLELLHIHLAHSQEASESFGIIWSTTKLHPHMKELVLIGFTLTGCQMELLKYLVSTCTSLRRLVLLKDGHVRYNRLWDWDIVGLGQQECQWRIMIKDRDKDDQVRAQASRSTHLGMINLCVIMFVLVY